MDKKVYSLLKDSFDRELISRENDELLKALKENPELKEEAKSLQKMRDLLSEHESSFGPFFTEKVLGRLEHIQESNFIYAFKRIALPGLIAALILLLITILGNQSISFDSLMGVETLQPEYLTDFLIY